MAATTVKEIIDTSELMRLKVLNGNDSDEIEGYKPIMSDIRIAMTGDGNPTAQAQNQLRAVENHHLGQTVLPVFGGFHVILTLFKKLSTIFGDIFLRSLFEVCGRLSIKQQQFVLSPGDPKQVEQETTQIVLAIYVDAARQFIHLKRSDIEPTEWFKEDFKSSTDDIVPSNGEEEEDDDDDLIGEDDSDDESVEEEMYSDYDDDEVASLYNDLFENNDDVVNVHNNEEDDSLSSVDENDDDDDEDDIEDEDDFADIYFDNISVKPSELINFMVERAKVNPQAFIILMYLRFVDLVFMLQHAESKARSDLYLSAVRYAMILFINANATDYIEMTCNMSTQRACMSEAERRIFDTFVLFRKTRNGKSIFTDRCMEWTMRDIRRYLGNFFNSSTPHHLERIVLQMNEHLEVNGRAKKDLKQPPKNISSRCKIRLNKVFLEALVWSNSSRLWLGIPQKLKKTKPYIQRLSRKGIEETEDLPTNQFLYSMDTGDILYSDVLCLFSQGLLRSEKYFDTYHRFGDLTDPKRSKNRCETNAPKTNQKVLNEEVLLGLTTDVEKIIKDRKLYTKERVKYELSLINFQLADLDLCPIDVNPNSSKRVFAEALVEGRKLLKKNVLDWESKATVDIQFRYENRDENEKTVLQIIGDELKHNFFTLEGSLARADDDEIELDFNYINQQKEVECTLFDENELYFELIHRVQKKMDAYWYF